MAEAEATSVWDEESARGRRQPRDEEFGGGLDEGNVWGGGDGSGERAGEEGKGEEEGVGKGEGR